MQETASGSLPETIQMDTIKHWGSSDRLILGCRGAETRNSAGVVSNYPDVKRAQQTKASQGIGLVKVNVQDAVIGDRYKTASVPSDGVIV